MNFKNLKKQSGMTLAQFAEYFGIPLRTVESWHSGEYQCSDYLISLMAYKLEKEGIIKGYK